MIAIDFDNLGAHSAPFPCLQVRMNFDGETYHNTAQGRNATRRMMPQSAKLDR